MYVDRLKIENLRCFEKAQVALNYPGKKYPGSDKPRWDNVNVFIGENGAGKSTVCQALCIAALRFVLATSGSGFRTVDMIRQGTELADITAHLRLSDVQDGERSRQEARGAIKRQSDNEYLEMRGYPPTWTRKLFEDESPGLFLAAYGASRRTERPEAYNERLRSVRYQRIASLFEPHVGLIPLSLALRFNGARLEEIVRLINMLIPERAQLMDPTSENAGTSLFRIEPLFDADGVKLPLASLSDGFRLHIGWIIDFLSHLARVLPENKSLREAEGIVIIDEMDLLLHAEWQRHVVKTLADTFPRIQFLITTHSPIIAGSVDTQNLFLVDRTAPHTSEIHPCNESVTGRSVDEVLVKLFGLTTARAPEMELQLNELAQKAIDGDANASIEYLRRLRLGVAKP